MAWLRKHPAVFVFGSASYALFVTILVVGFFLLAVYVDQHLGRSGNVYAAADMFFALGSVLAGLAVHWLFRRTSTVSAIIALGLLAASVYFVAALNTMLGLFFLTYMLLGMANAGTRIMRVTWLFRRVPNGVIGRVNSVFNSLNVISRVAFIGLFSLPFFMNNGRVTWALVLLGAFVVVAVSVLAVNYRRLVEEPTLTEREAAG
jgi:MFS family permease